MKSIFNRRRDGKKNAKNADYKRLRGHCFLHLHQFYTKKVNRTLHWQKVGG